MFGKRANENSLAVPPVANENCDAVEVLRVWAVPGAPQQLTLRTPWKDPGAWGLLLLDVAHHAAQAYKAEGRDPKRSSREFVTSGTQNGQDPLIAVWTSLLNHEELPISNWGNNILRSPRQAEGN